MALELDLSFGFNSSHLVLGQIFKLGQFLGHRSQAGSIATQRHFHFKRLMWPFGVVAIPKLAKTLLTLLKVTPSRALVQNLHLQTAMKTFLLTLGLRVIGPSMNELDPRRSNHTLNSV